MISSFVAAPLAQDHIGLWGRSEHRLLERLGGQRAGVRLEHHPGVHGLHLRVQ